MINKLEINNIQSHKHSILEFNPGINIIVGSSNNGKSALMRAINWVVYNRPLGTETLASHWAINNKGKLTKPMSVSITIDDGYSVTRNRTASDNQYIINSPDGQINELNVVKSDVPVEISDILQLNDINIQRQMDTPFLLSETDGEVAKYFNKIVKLDIIDKVLSNAESTKRKLKNDIEVKEQLIQVKQKQQEKFFWLDDIEKLLDKYNRVNDKYNSLNEELNSLQLSISEYHKFNKISHKFNFNDCKILLNKLYNESNHINEIKDELNSLQLSTDVFESESYKLNYNFSNQKKLINRVFLLQNKCQEIKDKIDFIKADLDEVSEYTFAIEQANTNIETYKTQLPDICPLCGNKLNKGKCL